MARNDTGQVAIHAERAAIEAALARGVPLLRLSNRYGVSRGALYRHRKAMKIHRPHVFAALQAKAWKVSPDELEALRVEMSEGWLAALRRQFDKAEAMQDAAMTAENFAAFAQIAAQVRGYLLEIGKATGQIAEAARYVQINNFALSPSYLRLKYALTRAVRAHPEAREAILAALREVEAAPMAEPPAAKRLPNAGQFKMIEHEQPST